MYFLVHFTGSVGGEQSEQSHLLLFLKTKTHFMGTGFWSTSRVRWEADNPFTPDLFIVSLFT
jgi:hypothetical protein